MTEEQIDHLGHMNVRYYGLNARCATDAFIRSLSSDELPRHVVDDVYTRHHREQLLGTDLEVRSAVLESDERRLRLHHELRASANDELAATFVHGVRFVDEDGAVTSVPSQVLVAASEEVIALPDYASNRTVSLDADFLASAPTLDEVRHRSLEMREPRAVTAEECHEDGSYREDLAPMLTWGGEPIGGRPSNALHETADGELMAWASMETRLVVARWPRVGDQIQSFGAGIEIFDKVTHRIHWAFDLATGDLLNAFAAVSMAFDTRSRRPMSIPPGYREREIAELQPDLAPRELV